MATLAPGETIENVPNYRTVVIRGVVWGFWLSSVSNSIGDFPQRPECSVGRYGNAAGTGTALNDLLRPRTEAIVAN